MIKRNNIYQEYEDELEFIKDGKFKEPTAEALSATEVVTVTALQRQKAQLIAQKTKLENQLKVAEEQIAKMDAQISRMQAT